MNFEIAEVKYEVRNKISKLANWTQIAGYEMLVEPFPIYSVFLKRITNSQKPN